MTDHHYNTPDTILYSREAVLELCHALAQHVPAKRLRRIEQALQSYARFQRPKALPENVTPLHCARAARAMGRTVADARKTDHARRERFSLECEALASLVVRCLPEAAE